MIYTNNSGNKVKNKNANESTPIKNCKDYNKKEQKGNHIKKHEDEKEKPKEKNQKKQGQINKINKEDNKILSDNVIKIICDKLSLKSISKLIDSGGFSSIYEVIGKNNMIFVLKITKIDKTNTKKKDLIINEISLLINTNSSHIINCFGFTEITINNESTYAVLLEKAQFMSLKKQYSLIKQNNYINSNFTEEKNFIPKLYNELITIFFANQTIDSIEIIHQLGIVHYDIKPENLLLTNKFKIKLCDFNISKKYYKLFKTRLLKETIQIPGSTERYAGAEYYSNESRISLDNATKVDIFSFTVTLYYLFTFEHLIDNSNSNEHISEPIHKKIQNKIDFNEDINDNLKPILRRCLSFRLNERDYIYNFLDNPYLNYYKKIIYSIWLINQDFKDKFFVELVKKRMQMDFNRKDIYYQFSKKKKNKKMCKNKRFFYKF